MVIPTNLNFLLLSEQTAAALTNLHTFSKYKDNSVQSKNRIAITCQTFHGYGLRKTYVP